MAPVRDGLQELLVDTTAVFGGTPTRTRDASRIAERLFGGLNALVNDDVLPVVAEIVGVHHRRCVPGAALEVPRQPHLPAGKDRPVLGILVGRNADGNDLLLRRIQQPELVEVIVEPPHRVLDGDVQIPEGVPFGNLDPSPHQRVRPGEDDEKLVHELRPASFGSRATD
jgi:hypothetical protein